MKTNILLVVLLSVVKVSIVSAQLKVVDNNTVELGGKPVNMYLGKTAKYGGAAGKSLNPTNSSSTGLILENGISESAGIYIDGDFIVLWSPGDGGTNEKGTSGYLVKVYDEDGWQLRWFLDGAGTPYQNSDSTRKENIESLDSSLIKIKKIRCVRYKFKKSEKNFNINDTTLFRTAMGIDSFEKKEEDQNNIGFIAQEIEAIFPEVVRTDENGVKFINYTGLIPVAIQSIQEQQKMIDAQAREIETMKADIADLKKAIEELQKPNKGKNKNN